MKARTGDNLKTRLFGDRESQPATHAIPAIRETHVTHATRATHKTHGTQKVHVAFRLPPEIPDRLREAVLKLTVMKGSKQGVSQSTVLAEAMDMALSDLEARGRDSELARRVVGGAKGPLPAK